MHGFQEKPIALFTVGQTREEEREITRMGLTGFQS